LAIEELDGLPHLGELADDIVRLHALRLFTSLLDVAVQDIID
jgi:hypothetical protein